jgi:hypothetical protein
MTASMIRIGKGLILRSDLIRAAQVQDDGSVLVYADVPWDDNSRNHPPTTLAFDVPKDEAEAALAVIEQLSMV